MIMINDHVNEFDETYPNFIMKSVSMLQIGLGSENAPDIHVRVSVRACQMCRQDDGAASDAKSIPLFLTLIVEYVYDIVTVLLAARLLMVSILF